MTQVIDVDDPDHQLAWPRRIIAAELDRRLRLADTARGRNQRWSQGLSRLLRLAFTGPALAEEFDALGDPFGLTPDASQVSWVRAHGSSLTKHGLRPLNAPTGRNGMAPPLRCSTWWRLPSDSLGSLSDSTKMGCSLSSSALGVPMASATRPNRLAGRSAIALDARRQVSTGGHRTADW